MPNFVVSAMPTKTWVFYLFSHKTFLETLTVILIQVEMGSVGILMYPTSLANLQLLSGTGRTSYTNALVLMAHILKGVSLWRS